MTETKPVRIVCFTDVLCVWALVSEARVRELAEQYGEKVAIENRAVSVFGDTEAKIGRGWSSRGGYRGFNEHLREVARQFDHLRLHEEVWLTTRPASSSGAHLVIQAAKLVDAERAGSLRSAFRRAFFEQCRDIAAWSVQERLIEESGLARAAVLEQIESGRAFAALAEDLRVADDYGVTGSPTFVLNEGRQKLYGNVGYRILEANVRELIRTPTLGEASWC